MHYWRGGNSSILNVNKVVRCQKNFFRQLCPGVDRVSFQIQNGILDFESLFKYFSILKLTSSLKSDVHPYFGSIVTALLPSHSYVTRFADEENLNLPTVRLSRTRRGFLTVAINAWNELPASVKRVN